jgi:hypothetical protein
MLDLNKDFNAVAKALLEPFDDSLISQRKGAGEKTFSYVAPENYRARLLEVFTGGFEFGIVPGSLQIGKEGVAGVYRFKGERPDEGVVYEITVPAYEAYTKKSDTGEVITIDQTMNKLSSAGLKNAAREIGVGLHLYDKVASGGSGSSGGTSTRSGSSTASKAGSNASTGDWDGTETITFGKHNGTQWKDIDDGYLAFITKDPEKANATALKEIARRKSTAVETAQSSASGASSDDEEFPF